MQIFANTANHTHNWNLYTYIRVCTDIPPYSDSPVICLFRIDYVCVGRSECVPAIVLVESALSYEKQCHWHTTLVPHTQYFIRFMESARPFPYCPYTTSRTFAWSYIFIYEHLINPQLSQGCLFLDYPSTLSIAILLTVVRG